MFKKQHAVLFVRALSISRRNLAETGSYFRLFPQNFPHGGPPHDSFLINDRALRREYKGLQSESHPDKLIGASGFGGNVSGAGAGVDTTELSTLINRAYGSIKNPYIRLSHLIQLYHPDHIDITQDEVSKDLIAKFQSASPEVSLDYKNMLMTVLEAHESLEMATLEADLEEISTENDARILQCEQKIQDLLQDQWPIQQWNTLIMEAIRLKYWINIENAIRDWEPGKPVHLTH
jgi:molecular chaperone HscB